jgi:hypothetical protein
VTLERNFTISFSNNNKKGINCYVSMAILSILFYLIILFDGKMLVPEDVL